MTRPKDPKQLWFRAKRYGWGWFPVTWQGWLTVLIAVVLIILVSSTRDPTTMEFYVAIAVIVILLLYVSYTKGERPRWRWG